MKKRVICFVVAIAIMMIALPTFATSYPSNTAHFHASTLTNSYYSDENIARYDNTSSTTYRWNSPITTTVAMSGPVNLRPVNLNKVVMGPTAPGSQGYLSLTRTTYKHIRLKVSNDNGGVSVYGDIYWHGSFHD